MLFAWVGSPDPAVHGQHPSLRWDQNHQNYCSRPASRLLLKSNEELDPQAKRTALLNEADALMASHVVTLPLYARPAFLIHDKKLKGAPAQPDATRPDVELRQDWAFAG